VLDLIEQSAFARALSLTPYLYPATSALHVTGIGVLFGSILAVDLRLLGFLDARLDAALDTLTRLALAGFALAVFTGALLFTVQAVDYAANPAFLTKLGLIGLAGLNALAARRAATRRLAAGLSVLLWLSVIGAGRMIAFTI
jgi:hypothetical protein